MNIIILGIMTFNTMSYPGVPAPLLTQLRTPFLPALISTHPLELMPSLPWVIDVMEEQT